MAEAEKLCHCCGAAIEEVGYVKGCILLVCTECGYVKSDENWPDFRSPPDFGSLEDGWKWT
jgi:ribosome-binding protein aMBF1 (putative translation factor)